VVNKSITSILFEKGKIDRGQREQIESLGDQPVSRIEEFIIKKKIATEEDIARARSEALGVPFIDLQNFLIDPAALTTIQEEAARQLAILPLYTIKDTLAIAMAEMIDVISMDDIKLRCGYKKIQVVISTRSAILESIEQNYQLASTLENILTPIEQKGITYAPDSNVTSRVLTNLAGEPPVVKFVNQMLFDALKERASDIHVEPTNDSTKIRFRVDGVMHNVIDISRKINLPVIPRIKILANLDIAERRKPQDGRFTVGVAGRRIDFRVSVYPMAYGEDAVLRILDRTTSLLELEDLGFSPLMLEKIKKLIKSAHGIILVTGPTGSGKTTTLYAILNRLSSPDKNILTVENPIEYMLDNVNQSEVNPKIGLDFTDALRSFLRQDPDIMMIGEIRDHETAEIGFRAAITGHLLFSTLHTNDALTIIPRLRDLGLDKGMLSSTIICALAQRLVRTVCNDCRIPYTPDKKWFDDLEVAFDPKIEYFKGAGCENCHGTGYKGRIGIYELLAFNDEIRNLVQKDASLEDIKIAARKEGLRFLREDGLDKVVQGLTTIEEVFRVALE